MNENEIQTAENCQTQKRGRNEIITVDKIVLTNQIVLMVNCNFSSIVFGGCTQRTRFCLDSLKFDCTFVFLCQIEDFVWFSRVCGQAYTCKHQTQWGTSTAKT